MLKAFIAVLGLSLMVGVSHAEETVGEKVKKAGNTTARTIEKGGNRVKEAVCMDGDVKCGLQKGKHRVEETGSSAKDGLKGVKEKVD